MTSSVQHVAKYFCSISAKPINRLYFSHRCRLESCISPGLYHVRSISTGDDGKSSSSNESDKSKIEPKAPSEQNEKRNIAKSKLNDLLKSIVKETEKRASSGSSSSSNAADFPPTDKGNEKASVKASRQPKKKGKSDKQQPHDKEIVLGKRILNAVKKVAESMEGDPTVIENELVQKLKSQNSAGKVQLSDVFAGMKIEETSPESNQKSSSATNADYDDTENSRAARVRQIMSEKSEKRHRPYYGERKHDDGSRGRPTRRQYDDLPVQPKIDLFGARPLGIFSKIEDATLSKDQSPLLKTWNALQEKELKLCVTHPPANGFEEMIMWTEQGKLWKFPIDNEQGMDEEAKYSFEDHVFLETQIESWCPQRGPLRQFMELVCVGLGKNSYLTVPEKREYLNWYHEYFKGKSDILKEVGAAGVKSELRA